MNKLRRRFLGGIPAAFAGLFGLGRVRARADEPPSIKAVRDLVVPLKLTPARVDGMASAEQVRDELRRLTAAVNDPQISDVRKSICSRVSQALTWVLEANLPTRALSASELWGTPISEVTPPDRSEDFEYRVILRNPITNPDPVISMLTGYGGGYSVGYLPMTTGWHDREGATETFEKFRRLGGEAELQRRRVGSPETVA